MVVSSEKSFRRYDLDWLRVLAILSVYIFHSVHFFDTGDWSVKNATTYSWISWLMDLMGVWLMPLIFVVSGASVFYAAGKSNVRSFLWDKIMRLLIPLLIGVFTFSITQVYVERIHHGQFQGSLIEFIPNYFEGVYLPGGTGNFAFHGMHLWYVLLLFSFTLLFMPLFWWFKSKNGEKILRRIGNFLALPGCIFFIMIPTIIIQNLTNNANFIENGYWRLIQFPWFFIAGYLIISHETIPFRIIQSRWIAIGIAIFIVVITLAQQKVVDDHADALVWPVIIAILGFAMKHLNYSNSFLAYANKAVMPFYILHQNILLWLGFFVVNWSIPDFMKFVLISVTTFLFIMIFYQYLIYPNNWLRIIFGMKPIKKPHLSREGQIICN